MPANLTIQPGDRFGKLTAQVYHPGTRRKGERRIPGQWECLCNCGGIAFVRTSRLLKGQRSCGCLRAEQLTIHGFAKRGKRVPEFEVLNSMIQRCHNPNNADYVYYGARGVTVYDVWRGAGGFADFYAYVGPRPSPKHSIDRINNDGNYEPGNVRWATMAEQSLNKRNNVRLTLGDRTLTVTQWSNEPEIQQLGISLPTLKSRKSRGWSAIRILTTPVSRN